VTALPPTEKQVAYLRALQRKLRLPNRLLDQHCEASFGAPFAGIDRAQASKLIDELAGWEERPAEMSRAMGQVDLPGFGA
jgi:hypothetical protein